MPQTARVRKPSAKPLPDKAVRVSTEIALRPPLKWAGGKRWQVPHLRPLWDAHHGKRLVEPFCGGLGVAVSLMPSRALLNDVNPHVVNFYRWLKCGLKTNIVMRNEAKTYYANRIRFNDLREDQRPHSDTAVFSTSWGQDCDDPALIIETIENWRRQTRQRGRAANGSDPAPPPPSLIESA